MNRRRFLQLVGIAPAVAPMVIQKATMPLVSSLSVAAMLETIYTRNLASESSMIVDNIGLRV